MRTLSSNIEKRRIDRNNIESNRNPTNPAHYRDRNCRMICTFPIKAEEPPNLAIPTATFAGAPPGAFSNAGASASETPLTVGTKSISISPKQTTNAVLPLDPGFVFKDVSLESDYIKT